MDELLAQFLIEGRELVGEAQTQLAALLRDPADAAALDAAFRAFHTLKGSVGLFDMAPAGRILHAGEDLLEQARAGRGRLDRAALATLVECIDHVERWIDDIESAGGLPGDAGAAADRLVARLSGGALPAAAEERDAPLATAAGTGGRPDWVAALLDSGALPTGVEHRALVAFRYAPDAGCFFRGDDPLKISTAVPGLVAIRVVPAVPWPPLAEMAPFDCNIAVEGLSTAPLEAVSAAFQVAGEQASVLPVPARREEAAVQPQSRSLRIDEARIDALAGDVGELVVASNALAQLAAEVARSDAALGARLRQVQSGVERGLGALHRTVTAVRMVPLAPALRRLPRLAREIAASLGRAVDFAIEGEATEVDKAVADMLFEPLLHLLRNAIDHGVEPPERRRAAGKPERGTIRLRVARRGERLDIALSDDGAGMDPARIRAAAVSRGLLSAEAGQALDDAAALQLVFRAGFSTVEQASEISGRGVGMDAVKVAVEALRGSVTIDSKPGEGTTTRIHLPLSAITTRLLLVDVAGERYGMPIHAIAETAHVAAADIVRVGEGRAVVLRGRTLPVLRLAELLALPGADTGEARLLIIEAGGERVCVAVDGFGDQIEAMVRPPDRLLAALPAIAGTTVTGDGQVLIVLDPARLAA